MQKPIDQNLKTVQLQQYEVTCQHGHRFQTTFATNPFKVDENYSENALQVEKYCPHCDAVKAVTPRTLIQKVEHPSLFAIPPVPFSGSLNRLRQVPKNTKIL